MVKQFIEIFVTKGDDGYGGYMYNLTNAGYAAFIVVMLVVLLAAVVVTQKLTGRSAKIGIKQLSFSAMAIALATVASMIPMPRMPMGGHVTLFSLLIISLVGYWFGLAGGIACGVAYGTLQLLLDPYILSFPQLLCDYIFSFGALGLSGIFRMKTEKNEQAGEDDKTGNRETARRRMKFVSTPVPGYIASVLGRYFFAIVSGVVFFSSYAPETGILSNAWIYAIVYNGIYIGAEAIITIVTLQVPAFRRAIDIIGDSILQE